MTLIDACLALLVCALWGINYVMIKIGVLSFGPFLLMALRFLCVTILLFPWLRKLPRDRWGELTALALVMGIGYFGVLFFALKTVPAGEATIIAQLQVPLGALIAVLIFKEHLSLRTICGIACAMIGVTITVGLPQRLATFGEVMLVLLAALLAAIYNNQIKAVGKVDPLALNAYVALISCPCFFILSSFTEHPTTQLMWHNHASAYWALFYLVVISTIFGYSAWYYLLRKYPVHKVMPCILIQAPFALIFSHCLTGEPLAIHTVLGATICLFGLGLVIWKKPTPPPPV